jgi:hypothetical protein
LAGILLGVGVALQFTGGPAGWAKGLTIAGATITGLAVLTLSGLALAHPRPAPKPFSSILVFQIELPAAAVPENPAWGFEGGSISSVEKKCPAETCAFTLVISVDETFTGGSVTLKGGAGEYRFPTDSVDPHLSSEWCDWRSIGDARFRYRVNRY